MAEADDGGEGFLSRWARRKRQVEQMPPEDETPRTAPPEAAEPVESEMVDEELEANRQAAEAIDIETLGKDDDFTVFLKRGVPELLRRTALRKLWRTDPVFANVDGLNDYDEDFRNPAHNVYKSLWKVGRGFLTPGEQTAQRNTGRISQPPDEEVATFDDDEALADEFEVSAEDVPDEASPDVAEGETVAALEPDREPAEEAVAPSDKQPSEQDGDGPQQRRVSLRSRLIG